MGFFFTKQQSKRFVDVELLHRMGCKLCPLYSSNARCKDMRPTGSEHPEILVLGQGPGEVEDLLGKPFVGKSGTFLRSKFTYEQIQNIRFSNITRTRTPDDREPTFEETESCRLSIENDILLTRPKAVFTFGGLATNWFLQQNPAPSINAWRGHRFPAQIKDHKLWVFPMLHPAYLLRGAMHLEHVFELDIKNAYKFLERDIDPLIVDPSTVFEGCENLYSVNDIRKALVHLSKEPSIAIDLETTPYRPYDPRARILSWAIGTKKKTIAFPWQHREAKWTPEEFKQLQRMVHVFIKNKKQIKRAHNESFEIEHVMHEFQDEEIAYCNWQDTMSPAYNLGYGGNAKSSEGGAEKLFKGLMSLDNLCRIYFGFYIKSISNLDNTKLDFYPIEQVLKYNSLDTKYTDWLKERITEDVIFEGLESIVAEHDRRIPAVVLMQYKGLAYSEERAKNHSIRVEGQISNLYKSIHQNQDIIEYNSKYSNFNITTPAAVAAFFASKGYNVKKKVRDGHGTKEVTSSDDEILKKIDHPVAAQVLEFRELSKLKSTYLDIFIPSSKNYIIYPDKLVHGEFTTHFTTTGRTSSNHPNLQNFPKRKNKEIRDIIIAPDGYVMASCDYGQLEYRVLVMASKDPKLIDYVWSGKDIHADWALKIAKKYPKRVGGKTIVDKWLAADITKLKDEDKFFAAWRDIVKNGWVFAAFYGAGDEKLALTMTIPENIIKELHEEFWAEFSGVKEWHKWAYEFYKEHGYIPTLTNRHRYAYIQGGQIINCLSDDTEILTLEGWKFVDQLKKGELAYSVNSESGKMEINPIENIFISQKSGKMWQIEHNSISAITTPDHRWLVDSRNKDRKSYTPKIKETQNLSSYGDDKIWISSNGIDNIDTCWSDDEIRLMGWVLTDGGYVTQTSKKSGVNYSRKRVYVTQSKKKNLKSINDLFTRLGKYSKFISKKNQYIWFISSDSAYKMRKMMPDKTLTMEVLMSMSRQQLEILFETMLQGDGCWDKQASRYRKFVAGSKDRADIFLALCALIGQSARSSARDFSKYSPKKYESRDNIPKSGICWIVELVKNKRAQPQYKSKWIEWKGRVWCPTLKNQTWIAKRNGKVYITGNTPIQGSGSDIVIDGMVRLSEYAVNTKQWEYQPIINIHDDLGFYLPKATWRTNMIHIIKTMLTCPYDFVNVPLAVEAAVGLDWVHQKKIGTFTSDKLDNIIIPELEFD